MDRYASALSRRRFCRGSLAAAGGLALWRGGQLRALARAQEGEDAAERRQVVSDRIARFKRLSSERLLEATQDVKLFVESPFGDAYDVDQFDSPLVALQYEWQDADEFEEAVPVGAPFVIGKPKGATGSFPTLGLLDTPVQRRLGDDISSVYHLQGVYLGRTEHPVQTDIGPVTVSIGYFGLYFGAPDSEEGMTKVVIPGMVGWIAESEDGSFSSPLVVLPETSRRRTSSLLREGSDTLGPTLSGERVLDLLDQNIGRGVVALNVGDSAIPFDQALLVAQGLGFPTDFFTVDAYRSRSQTTRDLYDRLVFLTLKHAHADGHTLWTVDEDGEPLRVSLRKYRVQAEDVPPLPNLGRFLDSHELSIRALTRAPVAVVGPIFRGSVSLFEEE